MSRLRLRRRFFSRPNLLELEGRLTPVNVQNVLVNNPATDKTSTQDTQSETSTIVFGNTVLASFNDSGQYGGGNQHFTGWARSTDGGATFTDQGSLPGNDDLGDPSLARDTVSGKIYFASLSNTFTVANVMTSTDGGATLSTAVNPMPGISGPNFDKEWITVDNYPGSGQGNVYFVIRDFGTSNGIEFSKSTNGGASWTPTTTPLVTGTVQGGNVIVGPDHSVYFFWLDGNSGNKIMMKRSTNFGASFGGSVTVATLTTTATNGGLSISGFRTNAFPQSAINPVTGQLYVVYNDDPAGADRGDVFVSTSTNNGTSWTKVKINDDAGTNDQWQPAVSVSPDGTKVAVSYYDRRLDSANSLIDYYANIGTVNQATGAIAFGPGVRVTNTSFPAVFGMDGVVNGVYMGDYDTSAVDNNFFYFVWGDNRDPSSLHTGNNSNVRLAKVSTALAGPSVNSVLPTGLATPGIAAVDVNFNQGMDTTSFDQSVDISSFTGPGGIDLTGQVTGYTWTNANKTLHVTFNAQMQGGPYQMKIGPNINNTSGVPVDDDLDGTAGEAPDDVTTINFNLPVPQATGSTPSGTTAPPVNNLQITFNQVMDPSSFAVADDVVSFTGPAGNMISQVTGYTWTNANKTLQINFNPLNIPGSYALVLAPSVLTAAGQPIDQNANGIGGENPGDRYTATFNTAGSGSDAFGYSFAATTYDATDVLVPGATGVTTLTSFTGTQDDGYASVNLGTNKFRFYGTEYTGTQIFVSTNGLISFGVGDTAYNNTDLTSSPSEPVFAAFWDDQRIDRNTATDDLILTKLRDLNGDGTPDQLVVCWRNIHWYANTNTGSDDGITYSAVLELNTGARSGDLIANYTDLSDGTGLSTWNNGVSATVGIKDTGTQGGNRVLIHNPPNLTSLLVATGKAVRFTVNQPPTAAANGPYTVVSGGTVVLSSAGTSDPNQAANTLYYLWDLDGDGVYGESGTGATRGDENVVNPTFNAAGLPVGSYTVHLRLIDSGGLMSETTAVVNVTPAPPRVQSVTLNDGSVQRSMVTSLTVAFDGVVTLPANPAAAFTLTGPAGTVSVTADTSLSTGTQTIVKLTFSGAGTTNGSLDDGRYALTALAAQVSGAGGQLDGDGDGTGGDNYALIGTPANGLFRLFGDADGNGTVDVLDFGAFRGAFGTANATFDFDGGGAVDVLDFGQFRQRFGTSV